jgi:hypothetical protein
MSQLLSKKGKTFILEVPKSSRHNFDACGAASLGIVAGKAPSFIRILVLGVLDSLNSHADGTDSGTRI